MIRSVEINHTLFSPLQCPFFLKCRTGAAFHRVNQFWQQATRSKLLVYPSDVFYFFMTSLDAINSAYETDLIIPSTMNNLVYILIKRYCCEVEDCAQCDFICFSGVFKFLFDSFSHSGWVAESVNEYIWCLYPMTTNISLYSLLTFWTFLSMF